MKIFCILFSFISVSWALDQSVDKFETLDSKIKFEPQVSTLEYTKEEQRFLLPTDLWAKHKQEMAKGKYLRIHHRFFAGHENKIGYDKPLSFFKTLDKKGPTVFEYNGGEINFNNDKCFPQSTGVISSNIFNECGFNYCVVTKNSESQKLENFRGLNVQLLNKDKNDCPYPVRFFNSSQKDDFLSTDFEINEVFEKEKVVSVNVGEQVYFLDISFCDSAKGACKFFEIKISNFNKAMQNLERVKSKKDYKVLNFLLKELKPCVDKKDIACVRNFFVTPAEVFKKHEIEIPNVNHQITSEMLTKLKTCLDYSSLLPYGGRSKASRDEICIFDDEETGSEKYKYKIFSISLPDAYKNNNRLIRVNYSLETK